MHIHTIDLYFRGIPQAIAAYLVEGPEGPVLVETGPTSTLEALKTGLTAHGYAPSDIRHVLLTHIHLDHAGAAGWWAQQGAQVYVHTLGAPHLADPSRLLASAERIYGDMMQELWGEVPAAPAERVTAVADGETIRAAGMAFTAIATPGHAWHHHTFRLGNIGFTGDATGIRLPGSPLVSLPTPPPEFDLDAWHLTIDRLASENFTTIYPTHFDALSDVPGHLAALDSLLDNAAALIRAGLVAGCGRDLLVDQYAAWNRERAQALGVPDDVFWQYAATNPQSMSVDGMVRYWRKQGVA